MDLPDELRRAAVAWIDDDPDPATRDELRDLLDRKDRAELEDRFLAPLRFGTAGLRGLLGAGPNRMNRKVVIRATAGLCRHVASSVEGAEERGLCIGFDGRRMSRELADDVARVALGMGFSVRAFDDVVPTPLLGFACKKTRAAAAVMVTASHNPPAYNGYKVFWENGAQIIAPQDQRIAEQIAKIESLDALTLGDLDAARAEGRYGSVDPEIVRRYLDGVRALQVHPGLPRDVSIAYTAMHGVGAKMVCEALREAGFDKVYSVPEQEKPDGEFPTVAFPNPEEEGAMDLVLALANEKRADLVLANDPDADRLAVAVRDRDGEYVSLTGNEVGCVLGHYLLDQGPAGDARLVVNTIVSSPMLGAIAEQHGARWEQTLTGFKWIANRALELESDSEMRFVLGYEEALGYTVGSHVRDKDGVSTAVVVADLAAWCDNHGRTILDELETAWRRYGMFLSRQVSHVLPGADGARKIAETMDRVRAAAPKKIGSAAVTARSDLQSGERVARDGTKSALSYPRSNVLAYELEGGHRVMLRPSGTEPKIKFYFDAKIDVRPEESIAAAKERGAVTLDELAAGLARTASL